MKLPGMDNKFHMGLWFYHCIFLLAQSVRQEETEPRSTYIDNVQLQTLKLAP